MSRPERRVFWAALYHLARLRWRMSRVTLAQLLEEEHLVACERSLPPTAGASAEWEQQARRAVARAAGVLPRRTRCLLQSLVEIRVLRAHGFVPELRIGFRRTHDGRLLGHAWVPCLSGNDVTSDLYRVAARYSCAGLPLLLST